MRVPTLLNKLIGLQVYNKESYFAGVDKEAWETSVVEESYGRFETL